jgi:ribose/xylose/arabinose/galactoside ABC-type transport system permease subunit
MKKYSIYAAFVLLVFILSFVSPAFMTPANLLNVLRQISINGILAVGLTFVIISGGIDLSVGSILALASVVSCSLARVDSPPLLVALMAGVLTGLACGMANGWIISRWKVAPFIVTLAMMTAARGLTLVYSSGRPIVGLNEAFKKIGGGYLLGIPMPIFILAFTVIAGFLLLHYTAFGRHVYAVGGNEEAARLSGLQIRRIKLAVYALSGVAAGLAGMVLSSRIMAGSPSVGQGYELDAIAAVVIGGTSLSGGTGTLFGTVAGALIIGVMNNGLDLLNVSSYYQQIIKGVIIVAAVLMERKGRA